MGAGVSKKSVKKGATSDKIAEKMFVAIDQNGDGVLSTIELHGAVFEWARKEFKQDWDMAYIKDMMARHEQDADGKISLPEFKSVLKELADVGKKPKKAGPKNRWDVPEGPGSVIFSNVKAFAVPDADMRKGSGLSDPFVKFTFVGTELSAQSGKVPNTQNPVWADEVELALPAGFKGKADLRVSVWDGDVTDEADVIGGAAFAFELDPDLQPNNNMEVMLKGRELSGTGGYVMPDFKITFKYVRKLAPKAEVVVAPPPKELTPEEKFRAGLEGLTVWDVPARRDLKRMPWLADGEDNNGIKWAIDLALSQGKTPLLIDNTMADPRGEKWADKYLRTEGKAQVLEAEKMFKDEREFKRGNGGRPHDQIMREARKKLVAAMADGLPFVVRMAEGDASNCINFCDGYYTDTENLPIEVFDHAKVSELYDPYFSDPEKGDLYQHTATVFGNVITAGDLGRKTGRFVVSKKFHAAVITLLPKDQYFEELRSMLPLPKMQAICLTD